MPQVKMQRRKAPRDLKDSWSFAVMATVFSSKLSKMRLIDADFLVVDCFTLAYFFILSILKSSAFIVLNFS